MGYHYHQALVVTSYSTRIEEARTKAKEILARDTDKDDVGDLSDLVTEAHGGMNGVMSFSVLPSGSEAGWPMDNSYRVALKDFTYWLREEDYDFVSVRYGGDSVGMGMDYSEITSSQKEAHNFWLERS